MEDTRDEASRSLGESDQSGHSPVTTANTYINTQGGSYIGGQIHAARDVVLRDQWNIYHGLSPEQLDAALLRVVQAAQLAGQPTVWDGRDPYPGLSAFQEAEAALFFGRDIDSDEVIARLGEASFLCIAGPSGSGKSSLFQAGVVPHLRRLWQQTNQAGWVVRLVPGEFPLVSLVEAMVDLAQQTQQPGLAPRLPQFQSAFQSAIESDPNTLCHLLQTLAAPNNHTVLLFIDQFEEVFTQNKDLRLGSLFIEQVAQAARGAGPQVKVVLAMRSDFISACADHPQLNALINKHFLQIGPLQPSELAQAILGPAAQVGVTVQPALAAQVIADMRNEPGALPLMQFALRNMFMAQGPRLGGAVALTHLAYEEGGSVFNALNRHADAVLAALTAEQQAVAQSIFLRLIEIGQAGKPDTRRTEQIDELMQATGKANPEIIGGVIQALAGTRARLLTTGQTPSGQRTLTLTHERLIQSWQWLHTLVEANREDIRVRNRLNADVEEWERKQCNEGLLYSGARLEEVLASMKRMAWQVSPLEANFIEHSTRRDSKFERARYMAQARGGAIGGGLGFSAMMALAFVGVLTLSRSPGQQIALVLLLALLTLPIGAFIGFLIGIGLWVSRKGGVLWQVVCAGGLGGLAGGIALVLSVFALDTSHNLGGVVLAGAVLGLCLGVGVAVVPKPNLRVLISMISGVLGMAVTSALGVIFKDQLIWAMVSGVLLGGQLGLGVDRNAVNRANLNPTRTIQTRIVQNLSALLPRRQHKP